MPPNGDGRGAIAQALMDMFDVQAPAVQSASLTPGPSIGPSVPTEAPAPPPAEASLTPQAVIDQGFAPFGPNFDQTFSEFNALDPVGSNVHGEAGVGVYGPGDPYGYGGSVFGPGDPAGGYLGGGPGVGGSAIGGAGVTGFDPVHDAPAIDPTSYSAYASADIPGSASYASGTFGDLFGEDPYGEDPYGDDPYGDFDPGDEPGDSPGDDPGDDLGDDDGYDDDEE